MAFNQIIILGNLGKDAEVKPLESGINVISFNVAVTEKWKDKNDQDQERTDWFTVDYFSKSDKVAPLLKKGSAVMVAGRMVSHEYEKDGTKRISWSVRADTIQVVTRKDSAEAAAADGSGAPF